MRKSFEAENTMATAYTAIVNPTKRQIRIADMNEHIIHTGSPGTGLADDFILVCSAI